MILLWAWAKAHWKPLGALALLALAFIAGRRSAAQPAVTETVSTKAEAQQAETKEEHKAVASRDIEIDVGGWAPPVLPVQPDRDPKPDHVTRPAMPIIPVCANEFAGLPPGSRISIHEGPSTDDTHATSQASSSEEAHTQLTISASSPRWALGGGFLDPLGARQVHLEAGMRLPGPFWLRVGATPARGLAGTNIGAEIHF